MKLDISLYIPVYNGESTIERVLKSALELDPGPNEIIVINDGSTDDTLKILNKYNSKIKIINNIQNKGLAYSRNIGIENAKGNWISFLDSDDYWHPDKLKYVAEKIMKEKPDMVSPDKYIIPFTIVASENG